jgi:carbonic anhydrase
MERLIEGFQRFRADDFGANRARFERLAGRPQHPRYAIVTCCDSRIETTRVFDAFPGEVFLIRNIANLVPPPARPMSTIIPLRRPSSMQSALP